MKNILDLASRSACWTAYIFSIFDFKLLEKLKQVVMNLKKLFTPFISYFATLAS